MIQDMAWRMAVIAAWVTLLAVLLGVDVAILIVIWVVACVAILAFTVRNWWQP